MYDTIEIDHDAAAASIEAYAREGRLVQGEWHRRGGGGDDGGDGAGRDFACLLGAIHPSINHTDLCPASLMPAWMARLTVRLFDGIAPARTREFGLAYAERLHRWRVLDAAGWERVRCGFIGEVMDGVISRAAEKIGDRSPDGWAAIQDVHARLKALLLAKSNHWDAYGRLRTEAQKLRQDAWSAYHAARRRRAAAEAAGVAVGVAVAERATPDPSRSCFG